MKTTVVIDKKDLLDKYPKSGYPCLEYCKYLVKHGQDPEDSLMVWNSERVKSEADWTVPNIGEYAKNKLPREKMEEWRGSN